MTLPSAPDFIGNIAKAQALLSALPDHLNAMAEALSVLPSIQSSLAELSEALALISPAGNVWPITPDDEVAISPVPRSLYVGTGGTIILRAVDGQVDVAIVNVPDGAVLDIRAAIVRESGTTASDIVGLA